MIRQRRQKGFGLVELMIGLAIGLFLLAGLSGFFGQNKRSYAYQQAQAGQQTSERLVDVLVRTALQQAGFSPMTNQRIVNHAALFPASAPFGAGESIFGTENTANVTINGVTGLQTMPNDTLAVRYWNGPGVVDCVGNPIPADTLSSDLIATDGVNLTCATNGAAARPLIGDDQGPVGQQIRILGLAIGYGLDSNNDGSVDTFQRASGVTDWDQPRIAELELTIQAGDRPPETLSFVVALENMQGTI